MKKFKIKSRPDPSPRRAPATSRGPLNALLRNNAGQQQSEDSAISSDEDDNAAPGPHQGSRLGQSSAAAPAAKATPQTPALRPAQQQQMPSSSMSAQRSFLSSVSTPAAMSRPQASRLSQQTPRYAEGSLQALLGRPPQQTLASPKAVGQQHTLYITAVRNQPALWLIDCAEEADSEATCTVILKAQVANELDLSAGKTLHLPADCDHVWVNDWQVLMPLRLSRSGQPDT